MCIKGVWNLNRELTKFRHSELEQYMPQFHEDINRKLIVNY